VLSRRGATLIELLVATTLAAVVLGAATSTFLHERRDADAHASTIRAESQLAAALGLLQAAFDGLSAGAGDLVAGEARDTAIQLRTVVGSGVACDSGEGAVNLVTDDSSTTLAGRFAVAPRAGDTLWWRPPTATTWLARRVTGITTANGACSLCGATPRTLLRLAFAPPDTLPRGAPIRLTRHARFSFYRAGDGTWQLGVAEWSEVLHAFASPQPVAGPFILVGPGGARTGFRYFDASGAELPVGVQGVPAASVARVRIRVIAPQHTPAGSPPGYRQDSLDVAQRHVP